MNAHRAGRRLALVLLVAFASTPMNAAAQPRTPAAAEASKALADADKLAKAKDWAGALDHYLQANQVVASDRAQLGVATAYYELKRLPEAYDAYDFLLKTYGDKLTRAQKADAEAKKKDLESKTGLIVVTLDVKDASVTIDEKPAGATPLAPVRTVAGPHNVRVTKDGYVPFTTSVNVQGGASTAVAVALAQESSKGHLVVREHSGKPIRVLLDGLDVGDAPYEKDVEPGIHTVAGRSATAGAPAQTVEIRKGERREIDLVAVPAQARLIITTSDNKGNIYVDGKLVAEGTYTTDASIGPHVIEVKREGFDTARVNVNLADKEVHKEEITLRRPTTIVAGPATEHERPLEGVYGGFAFYGVTQVGAMGSELDIRCGALGAASCDTPSPLGAGAFGFIGYTWNPVGFELFLGGMFDTVNHKAHFDGTVKPGDNPLVALPARDEKFTFYRYGGMAALRVRASLQSRAVRFTFAGGVGASYKMMNLVRDVQTPDGAKDLGGTFTPKAVSYVSPGLSLDAAIHFRLGQPTAITIGAMMWAETAGNDTKTTPDPNRFLGTQPFPSPVATPEYHVATGSQIFFGPYIGMLFGP